MTRGNHAVSCFKALCPPNTVPLDGRPKAVVTGRGGAGRTISLPTASVSAVLVRAQVLVAEPAFAEDNLLQQFLIQRLHVKRDNRLGHARVAPGSFLLVINPRNNDFRANNPISWFTALIFRRSLQPTGVLSRHFLPSLSSAFYPP